MDEGRCTFYRSGVLCGDRSNCEKCGWHPREMKRRKEKIRLFGRDALVKKVEFDAEEYTIRFILKNLAEYGGTMTQAECQSTLGIGYRNFIDARNKAKARVTKVIQEVLL